MHVLEPVSLSLEAAGVFKKQGFYSLMFREVEKTITTLTHTVRFLYAESWRAGAEGGVMEAEPFPTAPGHCPSPPAQSPQGVCCPAAHEH